MLTLWEEGATKDDAEAPYPIENPYRGVLRNSWLRRPGEGASTELGSAMGSAAIADRSRRNREIRRCQQHSAGSVPRRRIVRYPRQSVVRGDRQRVGLISDAGR